MRWTVLFLILVSLTACTTQISEPPTVTEPAPSEPANPTTPEPDAPKDRPLVAREDTYVLDRGVVLEVLSSEGVLTNDSAAEGKTLSATLEAAPNYGTLIVEADGSFRYEHDGGETLQDSFSYRASDGEKEASALVTLLIDDKIPRPLPDLYSVAEGGKLEVAAAQGVLSNDGDPKGHTLSASLTVAPEHGTLELSSDGSFVYAHDHSETTSDQFVYEVSNGAQTVSVTVALEVEAVADAPVVTKLELAQTHIIQPQGTTWEGEKLADYELHLVGNRAALILVEVANDRLVGAFIEAHVNGEKLGEVALNTPDTLPPTEAGGPPYSKVAYWANLDKAWIQPGLELVVRANEDQTSQPQVVKVGAPTKFTMYALPFYLFGLDEGDIPFDQVAAPDEATKSEYFARHPVAELKMVNHPATKVEWPYIIVGPRQGRPAQKVEYKEQQGDGYAVMSAVLDTLGAIRRANGDGPTGNQYYAPLLMAKQDGSYGSPGGGLGGGSLGTGDHSYTGIFIHEAGHAFGMPHANDGYNSGTYPYVGGSLTGSSWGYDEARGQFMPTFVPSSSSRYSGCAAHTFAGNPRQLDAEGRCIRQDPMQSGGGDKAAGDRYSIFSDFNASVVQRDLEKKIIKDDASATGYSRWNATQDAFEPIDLSTESHGLYGLDKGLPTGHDVPVYTLIVTASIDSIEDSVVETEGETRLTYHDAITYTPDLTQIYPPLDYTGNLRRLIDPTDVLQRASIDPKKGQYGWYCRYSGCDYTLKVTFADNGTQHIALHGGFKAWFSDDIHADAADPTKGKSFRTWGVNVPAEKTIAKVELLETPEVYNGFPETPKVIAAYAGN